MSSRWCGPNWKYLLRFSHLLCKVNGKEVERKKSLFHVLRKFWTRPCLLWNKIKLCPWNWICWCLQYEFTLNITCREMLNHLVLLYHFSSYGFLPWTLSFKNRFWCFYAEFDTDVLLFSRLQPTSCLCKTLGKKK